VASPSDNTIASWSALAVSNNATSGSALTDFPCLVEDLGIEEGSDVVAVKRVAGAPTPDADVVPGRIYVAKRGTDEGGLFFGANLPTKDVGDPLQNDWELQTKVYFVRNEEDDLTGDGQEEVVPMLCRMVLDPASAGDYRDECIAQGIERFQIQWGVDTDGDGDANAYVSELDHLLADDGVADPNDVVSARIHVLARSVRPDPTYTNTKTYRMGDMEPYTPNDNFYRRILSTTVVVRNVRGLNGLDF
jgi:type IV pilus assembly protein PilW